MEFSVAGFGVGCLQLALAGGDNLDAIEQELRAAKARLPWLQMLMLPELFCFGVSTDHAQPMPGPAEDRLARVAADLGVWLVTGSLFEKREGRVYNTASVIDPSGRVIVRYRKMYPFLPYERGVAGGDEPVVFDVPGVGRFGLSICFDMWFPETTRTLAFMGAEVILHPSLTNTIDREAERAIARGTAAVNQCYFLDLNGAGDLGFGRSGFYGPGGEVIWEAGENREVIALDLDLDYVRRVRERGWHGLAQALKSFRDGPTDFAPYRAGARSPYLDALGPLERPMPETPAAAPSAADDDKIISTGRVTDEAAE
jgi:predicted amidohydrolase